MALWEHVAAERDIPPQTDTLTRVVACGQAGGSGFWGRGQAGLRAKSVTCRFLRLSATSALLSLCSCPLMRLNHPRPLDEAPTGLGLGTEDTGQRQAPGRHALSLVGDTASVHQREGAGCRRALARRAAQPGRGRGDRR